MKKFIIAIDLHGTLLDDHWVFPQYLIDQFLGLTSKLNHLADFYLCTGNDLQFIRQYVPIQIQNCFKGYILETGCVYSDGKKEMILTEPIMIEKIKELESLLKLRNFPFIQYFAHRHSSISLFTVTESGGENPMLFIDEIDEFLKTTPYYDLIRLTWSNVALDILPKGFSKFTGIRHITEGQKIISFLDSMNDYELAIYSDITFLPANSSASLLNEIVYYPVQQFNPHQKAIWLCNESYGHGVIEGLTFLVNQKGLL